MNLEAIVFFIVKVTLLLSLALLFDLLLRRWFVLTTAAMWDAVLIALVIMPHLLWFRPPNGGIEIPSVVEAFSRMKPEAESRSEKPLSTGTPGEKGWGEGANVPATSPLTPDPSPLSTGERGADRTAPKPGPQPEPARFGGWTRLALGLYVFGVAAGLLRLFSAWRAIGFLRHETREVTDSQWLAALHHWRGNLRLKHRLKGDSGRLLCSDRITVPIALGVFRRVIVIPAGMVEGTPPQMMASILIHELAHVARFDYFWQFQQRIVEAVFWFHPLVWLARRRIAFIRERACDEFVVHALGDRVAYSEVLLDIAAKMTVPSQLALGLAVVRSGNLSRRLAALQHSKGRSKCRLSHFGGLAVTVLVAGLAGLFMRVSARESGAQETHQPAPESFIHKLPDGITVELVSVAPNPSPDQTWWHPDGTPGDKAAYRKPPGSWRAEDNTNFARMFVATVEGLPKGADIGVFDFKDSLGITSTSFRDPKAFKGTCFADTDFPKDLKATDGRLGIAVGEWTTVGEASGLEGSGNAKNSVLFAKPQEENGNVVMVVAHDIDTHLYRVQLVAKLESGLFLGCSETTTGRSQFQQINATFYKTTIKDIHSYQLQARPYQWVTFKNVQLQPKAIEQPGVPTKKTAQADRPKVDPPPAANAVMEQPPAFPEYVRTLPTGQTVELFGVSTMPPNDKSWWRPDGVRLPRWQHGQGPSYGDERIAKNKEVLRAIGVRINNGLYNEKAEVRWEVSPKPGVVNSGSSVIYANSPGPWAFYKYASFSEDLQKVDVKFGVALGPWQSVFKSSEVMTDYITVTQAGSYSKITDNDKGFTFSMEKAIEAADGLSVIAVLTTPDQMLKQSVRLVAVDRSGTAILPSKSDEPVSGNSQYAFSHMFIETYKGLTLKDIQGFRLEASPFQWVEFKDVQLQPAP